MNIFTEIRNQENLTLPLGKSLANTTEYHCIIRLYTMLYLLGFHPVDFYNVMLKIGGHNKHGLISSCGENL